MLFRSAFHLEDSVSARDKKRRLEAVMEIQQGISQALNHQKVGKEFKVLVDRKEDEMFIGRTEFDSPDVDNEVLIEHDGYLRQGDFVKVKITGASDFDLQGKVIN